MNQANYKFRGSRDTCISNNSFCFSIQTLKVQLFYRKKTDYYDKMSSNPQGVGLHLKVLRSSCISLIALLATSTTLSPTKGDSGCCDKSHGRLVNVVPTKLRK